MIAPFFEKLATELSRENVVTFVKIDTDAQKSIATEHRITAMPTFLLFRGGSELKRVRGADPRQLGELVKTLAAEAESAGTTTTGGAGPSGTAGSASENSGADAASVADGPMWNGAGLPRGYGDITDQVEKSRTELLNVDDAASGGVRVLFAPGKPSGRKEIGSSGAAADWVESDTDEQLMLFIPLQSVVKLHTLQVRLCSPVCFCPLLCPTNQLDHIPSHRRGGAAAADQALQQQPAQPGLR